MSDQKIGLTVFLIKPDQVAALEKALLTPGVGSIRLTAPLDGVFVPLASFGTEPKWVGAVQSVIQAPITIDMHSKSPAGLLVVKRPSGTFIVTFGHAWMKLEDSWLERDFGRRVALNAIPKDQVIEIKAEQVFAKWHLASERAPRASSVEEFGVEFDRDLVSVVEGIPTLKPSLGRSVRGGTSLRLNLPISELASVLDEGSTLFASDAYKKDWPDIDNINPVKDDLLIGKLEQALDEDFASGQAKIRIVMFTPSQRKDETILADSYVYGRLAASASTSPYLLFDSWLGYLAKKQLKPSVAEAKSSPLHVLDEDGNDIKTCSVFDCFGYEVSVGSSVFRTVAIDARGKTGTFLALTWRGELLLKRSSSNQLEDSQAVYHGFVKPREIVHDAGVYRMYVAEAERIEREGGRIQRVVLDYELKKRAYSPLAKAHDLPPLEYAERQQEIAKENGIQVVDGHLVLPDLRIEYEDAQGAARHVDLELATRNYRAAHIRSKAAASFKVYADTRSGHLAAVLDDHDLIAELLRS